MLWKLLIDKNARESDNSDQTDSDDDIEGKDKFKERELNESSPPFPLSWIILMDQTYLLIVNIAPKEGQIPGFFTLEPNWEAVAFPKGYSTWKKHFNEEREIPITPSKGVLTRPKCCDDKFCC